MTARPWRAVAYWPLPNGGRLVARRTARATRSALTPWLEAARADGFATDWWELLPHPVIDAAARAQVGPGPGGYGERP